MQSVTTGTLRVVDHIIALAREVGVVARKVQPHDRDLADQMLRAWTSAANHSSEGQHQRGNKRLNRMCDAMGSAREARTAVLLAEAYGYVPATIADADTLRLVWFHPSSSKLDIEKNRQPESNLLCPGNPGQPTVSGEPGAIQKSLPGFRGVEPRTRTYEFGDGVIPIAHAHVSADGIVFCVNADPGRRLLALLVETIEACGQRCRVVDL